MSAPHRPLGWRCAALALGLCCVLAGATAQTAPPRDAGSAAQAGAQSPRWAGLSAAQRQALKPLRPSWNQLGDAQRRKWIALARNFGTLPPAEQAKLHERMDAWVKLSPAERSRARLNFAAAEQLSSQDKQARWEAYQALSEDERRQLAEQAPRRALPGAATALRPIPRQRLATMPIAPENRRTMPRIATSPHLIHPQTLLPQVDADAAAADPVHKP